MTAHPPEISTKQLATRRGNPEHAVIDVRPPAAYNGWRLRGEPRGGHIPEAINLPLRWHRQNELATILQQKGISSDQPLTLYGYDAATLKQVTTILAGAGFENVALYPPFIDEWVSDTNRPLESLDRYQQLVSPDWVQRVTQGGTPPRSPDGEYVLFHVHANDRADYKAGHIPGAIPLDANRLEDPSNWNRRSSEELETALLNHGVRHDTTVVLYGRPAALKNEEPDAEPTDGHMAAMRCAMILLYAGVTDVRILDGGLASWNAAGFDLTSETTRPESVESFGTTIPTRPELFIDTPEAKEWLDSEDRDLVSVRSYDELAVETSGYDYISHEGRIPNAIPAPSGSDAHHVEEYRNPDQTMRTFYAVDEFLVERGVDPEKSIGFYCGTGWRASEVFMNAYLLGWTDIAVYDGGWYEWSGDPENSIS